MSPSAPLFSVSCSLFLKICHCFIIHVGYVPMWYISWNKLWKVCVNHWPYFRHPTTTTTTRNRTLRCGNQMYKNVKLFLDLKGPVTLRIMCWRGLWRSGAMSEAIGGPVEDSLYMYDLICPHSGKWENTMFLWLRVNQTGKRSFE